MDDLRVERVLRVVESIPPGAVATYGDVGKVAGESPRWVGRVLKLYGSSVPWWRVVNAKGEIPGHAEKSHERWRNEITPLTGDTVNTKKARITVLKLVDLSKASLDEIN